MVVGWLVFGGEEAEATVDAEIEQQINALIDDWLTAWNTADGQLGMDSFATDSRYVSGVSGFGGWSGEEIRAGIERWGGSTYSSEKRGDPLIIERPDSYLVVQKWSPFEGYGRDYFSLFNIVDENGSLKFRYVEDWYGMGWFQLADNLPPQPVDAGD